MYRMRAQGTEMVMFHHLSGVEGPDTGMVGATLAVALAPLVRVYHNKAYGYGRGDPCGRPGPPGKA